MGQGVDVRARSIRLTFTFNGKRYRQTLTVRGAPIAPTPANLKFAHRLAAEIASRIEHGTFSMAEYFPAAGAGTALTVAEQLDTWLAAQRVAPSTHAAYGSAIRFWKRSIGATALRGLVPSAVLTAIAGARITGKTLNNYVTVLRGACELAVLDRLMDSNPAGHVPRQAHQKPPVDPFTLAEAEAIVADAHARWPEQAANYVEAKFFTGLRTSESFGLRWPNVDLASGSILVADAIVRGKERDRTKTSATRLVRLNSRARAALERQRPHTLLAGEHVFHDPRYGRRWADERAFRRSYWSPTLKRLGIRYRQPYNTRHTYATMMLMAGMTPAFCATQMGHSVEVFLGTYAKWLEGAGDAVEMARLEARIVPGLTPETGKAL